MTGRSPVAAAPSAGEFAMAVSQVAERVRPAVVLITTLREVRPEQFSQPFTVPAGVGSGVIYDRQGYILTNNHVVEGDEQLQVGLPDGRSFPARLVGGDARTDLAVIKVDGGDLPVAQIGDSRQLQVGQWVVAIGNALGLPGGPTVTQGVVGALGRTVQEPSSPNGGAGPFLFDVIQTDAAINPGNSGGPLVNLQGQVIGINTLVAGQAQPGVIAQGIGFAIAISTAKPIADQLVASGRVVHASLGVSYVPLNPAIAARLGVSERDGVVIVRPLPGSPAASAGLRAGDVITQVDGQPLQEESALAEIVSSHQPGDVLTLTVVRGRETQTVRVTLGG